MAVFNCRQCGGILNIELERDSMVVCPFCGTRQTLYDLQEADGCTDVSVLLERAALLIEDREFPRADEYCERALNFDPQNAQAYLYKLFIAHRAQRLEDLSDAALPFDKDANYLKYLRFGDPEVCLILQEYNRNIRYTRACAEMNAELEEAYRKAEAQFRALSGYRDSDALADRCAALAVLIRKENTYDNASVLMNSTDPEDIEEALRLFSLIPGYRDADVRKDKCIVCIDRIREQRKNEARVAAEVRERRTKRTAVSLLLGIAAILIAILIFIAAFYLIPAARYNSAVSFLQEGDAESAYRIISDLDGYRDSEEQCLQMQSQVSFSTVLEFAEPGDSLFFGSYQQDDSRANGKEPIEWVVLDREDGRILLLSKYVLCAFSYHSRQEVVTWESSTLRKWLNDSFYDTAFSKKEEGYIQTVTLTNPDHPDAGIKGGADTEDSVFLLSYEEVEAYFPALKDMMAEPTAYALKNGAYFSAEYGTTWWWLRSPGKSSFRGIHVYTNGGIAYDEGFLYTISEGGVRPALWVSSPAE